MIYSSAMDTAENSAIRAVSDIDLRVPFYCEENAWRVVYRHLAGVTTNDDAYEYHVVFISNNARCCPFYRQRAKPVDMEDECVCWDYHVIVIRAKSSGTKTTTTEVLDVDSWMPYPCPINYYLGETFRPHTLKTTLDEQFHPFFRVIPAHQYIKYFYSDRMHMFTSGKWMAPPPQYQPIMNGLMHANNEQEITEYKKKTRNVSNLEKYIDMMPSSSSLGGGGGNCGSNVNETTIDERMGTVLTFDKFRARFTLMNNSDEA